MVAFNRGATCRDAESYYYDYLCGSREAVVPAAVAEHVERCAYCKAQIRQLEAALADCDGRDRRARQGADVADVLSLHFSHVGEDLTCSAVKPFLPALLIPSLEIRIPTPITVHVNHCEPCRQDLEAIGGLDLRPEQLARLGRLYGERPGQNAELCRRTRSKVPALASASPAGIAPEVLEHACTCPRCRALVYRHRERLATGRKPQDIDAGDLCSGISTADLFDYVVPYGCSEAGAPWAAAEEQAIPSHVRTCRECAGRMQALHRTVYGVAERADSGVSTVYTTGGEAGERPEQAQSLYEDYPICVKVHCAPQLAVRRFRPVARVAAAMHRGAAHPRFKPAVRAALLTAAMIPLAIVFLINAQTASGINARQLSKTLTSVENLHVMQYDKDGTQPLQETWIARSRGLAAVRRDHEELLYDVTRREITTRSRDRGTIETVPLMLDQPIDKFIESILGFASDGVPMDKEFERLTSDGDEVYELTWVGSSSDGDIVLERRLTVVFDAVTRLPTKVEMFRRVPNEQEWHPTGKKVLAYPSRQAIEATVEEMFPSGRSSGAPEGAVIPVVLVNSFHE